MSYDFIPEGKDGPTKGEKIHGDVIYEKEKYPEDLTEERIELNAAPATRAHMLDFLKAIENNGRPLLTLSRDTFRRQAASWPICRWRWAVRWSMTPKSES